jgi:UDP-glucose 4-epimerase
MRAIVIGGCGFLGGTVARELLRRGRDVIVFDKSIKHDISGVSYVILDIFDLFSLKKAMVGADEDYHYAGEVGTTELFRNPHAAVSVNISGTLNVLNAAMESKVRRMMYCAMPSIWLNPYSITKKAASDICLAYKKNFGFDVRVMRIFNAYGPGQHLHPVRKIIPIFTLQALHDLSLEIWGNGEQYVDLVYYEDAAKILIDHMQLEQMKNEVIDVDAAIHLTVREVADKIISLTGSKSQIINLPMRRGEDDNTYSIARTTRYGAYTTDIDTGLTETISYFTNLAKQELQHAIEFYYGRTYVRSSDLTTQAMTHLQSING